MNYDSFNKARSIAIVGFVVIVIFTIIMVILTGNSGAADMVLSDNTPLTSPSFLDWIQNNSSSLLAAALGISETLAHIPGIKSNSITQLICRIIIFLARVKGNEGEQIQKEWEKSLVDPGQNPSNCKDIGKVAGEPNK